MRKSARTITVLLAATLLLAGCVGPVGSGSPAASSAVQTAPGKTAPNGTAEATAEPTATPAPVPLLTAIGAVPDPSVAAADVADPYAALNRYTAAIYKPDREVYNLLYRAVDAMEPSADVSAYSLTAGQYAAVFDCLYSEAQLRFFYLAKAKLGEARTVLRPQRSGGRLEFRLADGALPERLKRLLELTHSADARVAKNGAAGEGGRRGRGVVVLSHGSS